MRFVCFAVLVALSACTYSPPIDRQALTPATDQEVFVHPNTGMEFPGEVIGFKRGKVMTYDREGRDISVSYNRLGPLYNYAVTVYAYPSRAGLTQDGLLKPVSEAELESEWDAVCRKLESTHKDDNWTWQVRTRGMISWSDRAMDGFFAAASYENPLPFGGVQWASAVYLLRTPHGFLKYRFSFPDSYGDGGIESMKEFLGELGWPDWAPLRAEP